MGDTPGYRRTLTRASPGRRAGMEARSVADTPKRAGNTLKRAHQTYGWSFLAVSMHNPTANGRE